MYLLILCVCCLQTATTAAAAFDDEEGIDVEESQATFGVGMPMPPMHGGHMGMSKGEQHCCKIAVEAGHDCGFVHQQLEPVTVHNTEHCG